VGDGACIPPVNGLIIRPLIEASRVNIENFAKAYQLTYITDETNASLDYSRNCIRNVIMPAIAEHFDNASAIIARNTQWLREEEEYLAATTKVYFDELVAACVKDYGIAGQARNDDGGSGLTCDDENLFLPINVLLSHPTPLIRRIIREAIKSIRGAKALEDIQANHIQAIINLAHGRTGREIDLPGLKARREYDNLIITKPTLTHGFSYTITLDTNIHIPEADKSIFMTLSPQKHYTQAFNYDKVTNILEVRTRRPGDKITLAGLGTKKLKDYFIDTKTPKAKRDQTPLLADGSNILWIMDENNRTNIIYQPIKGQQTCWLVSHKGDHHEPKHSPITNSHANPNPHNSNSSPD